MFNKKLRRKIEELEKMIESINVEKSSSAYLTDFQERYKEEGLPTKVSYAALLTLYKKESWVRACADVIQRTTLAKGFRLIVTPSTDPKQLDRERLKALKKLFKYPNSEQTMDEILGDVVTDLEIYGDAYIEIVRDKDGIPIELYNLYAPKIRVQVDEVGTVIGYIQKSDSKATEVEFNEEDVIHFALPNPGNQIYGLSPLESLFLPIECDLWAQIYNRNFFMNDATPRGHLDLGNCSKAQVERNRKYWREEMKGAKNAHKTIVTEGGATYKAIGTAPKDMEFLNQRKFNRDEILAVYGVPPGMVCVFENANRSNSKEQTKNFKGQTIIPLQARIASKLNRKLVSKFELPGIEFEFVEIDLRDEEDQSKIDTRYLTQGVYTINEIRKKKGLDPVDWGDKPLIKQNIVPLEVAPEGGTAPAEPILEEAPQKVDNLQPEKIEKKTLLEITRSKIVLDSKNKELNTS